MSLAELDIWISYGTTAATACLLVRLLWTGLAARYQFLFAYFLADVLQSGLAFGASTRSLRYGYAYFGGQSAKVVLAICLSIQLWLLALLAYQGLARFGRKLALYMMLGALALGAAGLLLEPSRSGGQEVFPHYFNAFEGALDSMVALFLVGATLFLLWFPVRVPRNVALVMGGVVVYGLARWATLLLLNLSPAAARQVSTVQLCLYLSCLIFWIFSVRRSGETATTVTGHRWNAEEAARLLGQLDAINARLEQLAR